MAVGFNTYGTLYPPQVALRLQSSVRGFTSDSFHKFGNVNAVNYACQTTSIGTSCFFLESDAVLVTVFSNSYYILDEDKIIFKENQ